MSPLHLATKLYNPGRIARPYFICFCHVERSRDISNCLQKKVQLEIPRSEGLAYSLGMTG